jgi:hypothetical protein
MAAPRKKRIEDRCVIIPSTSRVDFSHHCTSAASREEFLTAWLRTPLWSRPAPGAAGARSEAKSCAENPRKPTPEPRNSPSKDRKHESKTEAVNSEIAVFT